MRWIPTMMVGLLLIGMLSIPGGLWAAPSEAESVIAECQKRTGMGRESCIGFIKKYMNVERCQQYTQLSAEVCSQKLEAIRNSPEFESGDKREDTLVKPAPRVTPIPRPITSGSSSSLETRVLEVKQNRAEYLQAITDETKKILVFLREQGDDVTAMEQALKIFQKKQTAVLSAYDTYARLAALAPDERPALTPPREIVTTLLRETTEYYRTVLLSALRQAVREPSE